MYNFTLILGMHDYTEKDENAFFEAGCNDAIIGKSNNIVLLNFDRESNSFANAIKSAIKNVEDAGYLIIGVKF